ncbi:DUF1479-domain-containing protein [Vararia minispora EC-137]|uniref:DUF1479-domain-containing protein n=1 Tax=Vararia minispora EC-137 TaxID=1314806 RepID=A0ACB8QCI6_9AGAM|nr:DUF1479-domain-containing protein [Vararia minispora EC-137]
MLLARSVHASVHSASAVRALATATAAPASRQPKAEGTIASVFNSLSGEISDPMPARFSDLKKELWTDALVASWREILKELEVAAEEVASKGSDILPRVSLSDIKRGLSDAQKAEVRKRGTVIIDGGVSKEEALKWKQQVKDYIQANKDKVKGFPSDNIQAYEIYNSIGQTHARTHPGLIASQRALLDLWHASDPTTRVSMRTPIAYFDRMRIRTPGDRSFTLGPHIDGGSIERWEDPAYRRCWSRILGGCWREHDPFDVSPRVGAKQDLYSGPSQCSVFRPWQGWTSLSPTGPGEGTLRVCPLLPLATAYIILRPFFRPRTSSSGLDDWVVDLEDAMFPGSGFGKGQEMNELTHPHLQLGRTMVSVPKIEPGTQVYWHCDTIHAVESYHGGPVDSSVFYIPAVPLTDYNAEYLRDQKSNFIRGLPAPDFPGGEGETRFVHRGSVDHISSGEGRALLGFEPFTLPPEATVAEQEVIKRANELLL